jgi:hypothetical protein
LAQVVHHLHRYQLFEYECLLLVPRAFITVFRLFTKDEWYEIKLEMYSLRISPIIVDIYVVSWLFFGGYVLNPLLIGAMVCTIPS